MLHISSIANILRRSWTRLIALLRPTVIQPSPVHAPPIFLVAEGPRDLEFLKQISDILSRDDPRVPNLTSLEASGLAVLVCFGGGSIWHWSFRLAGTNGREIHIYDRETPPVTAMREHLARIVNLRPGCQAFLMQKRSLENYLHIDAIFEACGVRITFSDQDDVSLVLAQAMFTQRHLEFPWESLPTRSRRRYQDRMKRLLNGAVVDRMTSERLAQSDPDGEIRTWLTTIGQLVNSR